MTRTKIAVLVPCRDEATTVAGVVRDFTAVLPGCTVYVFDNNSADDTPRVAREAGAIVRSVDIPGKGNVVRRMFADVEADVYVLVDGDGTYDPKVAPSMIAEILESGYDLVNATRVPEGTGAFRSGHTSGNRLLASLVGWMFRRPVGDILSGYKACSRRLVKSFPVTSAGFEIETELMVHALELRAPISEVTTSYRPRPEGSESKLSTWGDGARILHTIVTLVRQGRPLAFFTTLGAILAVAGIALGIPILVTFTHTHLVPRLPTAVLATGLEIVAALMITAGLVLDTVTRGRREFRVLTYLSIPGPQSETDEHPVQLSMTGDPPSPQSPTSEHPGPGEPDQPATRWLL